MHIKDLHDPLRAGMNLSMPFVSSLLGELKLVDLRALAASRRTGGATLLIAQGWRCGLLWALHLRISRRRCSSQLGMGPRLFTKLGRLPKKGL